MGSGKSIDTAVKVSEQIKQQIAGLHSIVEVSSV